ncbi:hypothetical protein AVEN_198010-1 [Araneus ventricosus]|uniref:Uncharacterized protein n=1 Tax=Araneus ventricosus TaxID=182803 RepID=A0A4Y2QPU4_ARAVE|nr:hypothetical protein AVEN_198010-1 [Araneus ventricosus]
MCRNGREKLSVGNQLSPFILVLYHLQKESSRGPLMATGTLLLSSVVRLSQRLPIRQPLAANWRNRDNEPNPRYATGCRTRLRRGVALIVASAMQVSSAFGGGAVVTERQGEYGRGRQS